MAAHEQAGRRRSRGAAVAFAMLVLAGCVPPFSELQSARTLSPGRTEITVHGTGVTSRFEGESAAEQMEFGVLAGYGVTDAIELRARYISVSPEDGDQSINVLGFGPKVRLARDRAALFMPVGFAFGGDVNASDTFQFHPTLLLTLPVNRHVEINGSTKALVPLSGGSDVLAAVNLGLGLSSNLERWAIRPEFGVLFNPGESGTYRQFSLGFSFLPGGAGQPVSELRR
jgi:hypothetical protein